MTSVKTESALTKVVHGTIDRGGPRALIWLPVPRRAASGSPDQSRNSAARAGIAGICGGRSLHMDNGSGGTEVKDSSPLALSNNPAT